MAIVTVHLVSFLWILFVELVPNAIGVVLVSAAANIVVLYFCDLDLLHRRVEGRSDGEASQ